MAVEVGLLLFLTLFVGAAVIALAAATLLARVEARSGFPLPSGGGRLGCVDGLRGYLALSVLVHHAFVWMQTLRVTGAWEPPAIHFFNQLGAGSVGLFFMTTGLVFYPRVLRGMRATDWVAVYIGRVFRIVPLVVVATGIVTLVIVARTGNVPDLAYVRAAARWVTTWSEPPLLGVKDAGRINAYVLWSLWYEWLFYILVLPACALAMDLVRARSWPSWTVPVGLFVVGLLARAVSAIWSLPTSVLFFVPLFAAGMLAHEVRAVERWRARLAGPRAGVVAAVALLAGMVTSAEPYYATLPLFALFFCCVACGNSFGGLFSTRGALVLGECSFGIYLLHGIVLSVIFADGAAMIGRLSLAALPIVLPVAALAATIVAGIAYLTVERPAIRVGRALSQRWTGRRMRLDSEELQVAP